MSPVKNCLGRVFCLTRRHRFVIICAAVEDVLHLNERECCIRRMGQTLSHKDTHKIKHSLAKGDTVRSSFLSVFKNTPTLTLFWTVSSALARTHGRECLNQRRNVLCICWRKKKDFSCINMSALLKTIWLLMCYVWMCLHIFKLYIFTM